MLSVIGDVLPLAIGIAISPVPIIAVILMLMSGRARENASAFLVGWLLGLTAVVAVVLVIGGAAGIDSGSGSTLGSVVAIALGIVLLVLGARQWQKRPAPGEASELPAWMQTIDELQPTRAFLLGALLSGVNPKNLSLAIGAAIVMGSAALDLPALVVAVVVFVLLASASIIVPVVYALTGGESAASTLDSWRVWLTEHNATVMTVLLVVIGVVLVGRGLGLLD